MNLVFQNLKININLGNCRSKTQVGDKLAIEGVEGEIYSKGKKVMSGEGPRAFVSSKNQRLNTPFGDELASPTRENMVFNPEKTREVKKGFSLNTGYTPSIQKDDGGRRRKVEHYVVTKLGEFARMNRIWTAIGARFHIRRGQRNIFFLGLLRRRLPNP